MPSWLKNGLGLIACVLVCEAVGAVGSFTARDEIRSWYATLNKPPFNPPPWVFAPVWLILYALMGVAVFLVLRRGLTRGDVRIAAGFFVGQLVLNGFWSPVFFGMHSVLGGLLIVALMVLVIGATLIRFLPISRAAAWLLAPYLLWSCFATLLNASILVRNV